MAISFEVVGHILVWMFISEIILFILFEKSGKQFKFNPHKLYKNLTPYIKKAYYILSFFGITFVVALIESTTKFIDNLLISLIGSSILLYSIAFCFDFFYITTQLADVNIKNKWAWIPLLLFFILILLTIILKLSKVL